MKIAVVGANGHVGRVVVKEAMMRGHEVVGFVHDINKAKQTLGDSVKLVEKDAFALTHDDLTGFDYVVDAFASFTGYQNLDLATKLIAEFRDDEKTNLMFIIGASILKLADGTTQLENNLKKFANEPWIEAPIQQSHEFDYLQWIDNVNWTVVTPQNDFVDGEKTAYVIGGRDIMTNAEGKAQVSFANFASAMVDEMEVPKHNKQMFSVCDK